MNQQLKFFMIVTPVVLGVAIISYGYIVRRSERQEKVRMYKEGLQLVKSRQNPFYPQATLEYYDSLEAMGGSSSRRAEVLTLFKAISLIQTGHEQDAIKGLSALINGFQMDHHHPVFTLFQKELALCYLRLAERNNCVGNHTTGSCIYPIQGDGVYTDPYAAQQACAQYADIVGRDSLDLESRWLLNIAYMTIGKYPAGVPPKMLIPGLDIDSSGCKVNAFKDIAGDLGLNSYRGEAGGSIVEDFDNDGYLDIVTSSWDLTQSMHYFRNNGDGTFTDRSAASGLSDIKGGLNLLQADYNNDGFTDILVLRGAWMKDIGNQPKTLLKNNGDGTFTDVTIESGILSFGPSQAATWADFNNDGWLDLFAGYESSPGVSPHPDQLFINNHDGTFTNVADQAGCQAYFFMKGATSGDYDKDGWPDIFISGNDGRKMLLHNKGVPGNIPQFEDVTRSAGLANAPTYTFPTWFWDYDNDGWPDIFACGYSFKGGIAAAAATEALGRNTHDLSRMYLYHNNHDGTFTDVSKEMGLDHPVFAMGSNFGDIDNDGWPDMYLGTGNPDFASLVPNRMFKNIGGHGFKDITVAARVGNLQKGHGVAFADIDNDGDQDIFTRIGGAYEPDGYFNSFYLNPGQDSANNWISVLLKGTRSNKSAIGAHIQVRFKENGVKRTVYMDVNSGGSFGCNPFRKEIGIGRATSIDELVIQWPATGKEQVFRNLQPRQFLTIEEGKDVLKKENLRSLVFGQMNKGQKMLDCTPVRGK